MSCSYFLTIESWYCTSKLLGLDELLSHSEEIILLMRRLLNYIKERILHDDLSHLSELLIQHQVLMVRVILLLLKLLPLLLIVSGILY